MNRIDATFSNLSRAGEKALVAYVTAGDPSPDMTVNAVTALVAGGADLVELGLPFSDPLADGPVIQRASQRALTAGFRTSEIFTMIERARRQVAVPLMVMSYYNPLMQYGIRLFCRDLSRAGGDGLLIPDLPYEEEGELREEAEAHGLRLTAFVAPTTTPARLEHLKDLEGGFVYCVSVTGVTGTDQTISKRVRDVIRWIKEETLLPVVIGFGVSRPKHVAEVGTFADGAVVGSAFVRILETASGESQLAVPDEATIVKELTQMARELKEGFTMSF